MREPIRTYLKTPHARVGVKTDHQMSHRLHVTSPRKQAYRVIAVRLDADRKGLSPFRRRRLPYVRQVHGGNRRLELRPNGLVAGARDFEIGSSALPFPLAVVAWLNIGLVLLAAFLLVVSIWERDVRALAGGIVTIGQALLTLGAILQNSTQARKAILILNWLCVPSLLTAAFVAFSLFPMAGLILLLPSVVVAVTLWGLTARDARGYFGVGSVSLDWLPRPPAREGASIRVGEAFPSPTLKNPGLRARRALAFSPHPSLAAGLIRIAPEVRGLDRMLSRLLKCRRCGRAAR